MRITEKRFLVFTIFCIGCLFLGVDLIQKKYEIIIPHIALLWSMHAAWFMTNASYKTKNIHLVHLVLTVIFTPASLWLIHHLPAYRLTSSIIVVCTGIFTFILTFIKCNLSSRFEIDGIGDNSSFDDVNILLGGKNLTKYHKYRNRVVKNYLEFNSDNINLQKFQELWNWSEKSVWKYREDLVKSINRNGLNTQALNFCRSIFKRLMRKYKFLWLEEIELKEFFLSLQAIDRDEKILNTLKECILENFDSGIYQEGITRLCWVFQNYPHPYLQKIFQYYEICSDRKTYYSSFNADIFKGKFTKIAESIVSSGVRISRGGDITSNLINSGLIEIMQYLQPLDINFEPDNDGEKYNSNKIRSNILAINKLYVDNKKGIDKDQVIKIYSKLLQPIVELKKSGQSGMRSLVKCIVDNDLHQDLLDQNITRYIMKDLLTLEHIS